MALNSSTRTASCSVVSRVTTFGTTGPSMCSALRRPDREKGVGLVIPTLLTWPGSAIVHDIKGENWQLTAGWPTRFGRVLLFDPTNPGSAAYNPLLEVRRGDTEVRDAQNVAVTVVVPFGTEVAPQLPLFMGRFFIASIAWRIELVHVLAEGEEPGSNLLLVARRTPS